MTADPRRYRRWGGSLVGLSESGLVRIEIGYPGAIDVTLPGLSRVAAKVDEDRVANATGMTTPQATARHAGIVGEVCASGHKL